MHRLRAPSASTLVAVLVYVVEASLVLAALACYKLDGAQPGKALRAPTGIVLLAAAACGVVACSAIVRAVRDGHLGRGRIAGVLAANVWTIGLMFFTAEASVRALRVDTPVGPSFAGTLLLPKSWDEIVKRCRSVAARAAAGHSYLVFDEQLGWTVGANRHGTDLNLELLKQQRGGNAQVARSVARAHSPSERAVVVDDSIYMSSTEGIRSPRTNMSFDTIPAKRRIALVGDSFTFGLEVRYEDTWGRRLEEGFGPGVQVLNFGVDGYGIDQAYLRYRRDVPRWHPEMVILGIINDDLRRSMCVYGFLCFAGSDIPFAKPRLIARGDSLAPLNLPLPTPESIFTHRPIDELPFVTDDRSFDPVEWERQPLEGSYSIRFLLSRYRRWRVPARSVSDSALRSLNGMLLEAFVRDVRARHAMPLIVFFPSLNDFTMTGGRNDGVAKDVLRAEGIPFVDMTDCVSEVRAEERFVSRHYSPTTNAAVARCLRRVIDILP